MIVCSILGSGIIDPLLTFDRDDKLASGETTSTGGP